METPKNLEVETALQNIKKMEKHKNHKHAFTALANEHQIIKFAKQAESATGCELKRLEACLECHKYARFFYEDMLE